MSKHVRLCVCVVTFVLVCNQSLFCLCCSDMNNRSIAWWLRQIGLSQYTKTLESEYYGLEVCECAKCICMCLLISLLSFILCFNFNKFQFLLTSFPLSLIFFLFRVC